MLWHSHAATMCVPCTTCTPQSAQARAGARGAAAGAADAALREAVRGRIISAEPYTERKSTFQVRSWQGCSHMH